MSPSNFDPNGVYVGDTTTEANSRAGDQEQDLNRV